MFPDREPKSEKRQRFDSPQQEAFLNLWRTYDRLKALEDELFSQFDLTAQQYNTLRLLRACNPQKVPTLTLSAQLVSRATDITRLLDRLTERGLIDRERPLENRRTVEIGITEAGIALLDDLADKVRACHQQQLGHLTPEELQTLTHLLRKTREPHETPESNWRYTEEKEKMVATSNHTQTDVDVVVIGGGPAGSTCSTLIAQQGHRVRLFEREKFPRFHIGESLIPETYWVLKRLNMLEKMKKSAFVQKVSVQFVNQRGRLSEPFYFTDHRPHECSETWQVLRSEFDEMMLNNAREHGVDVHEGVRVREVLFEGDKATGVRVQYEDGRMEDVSAKVVVDASGQSTVLGTKFNLLVKDTDLKKGAVWTYWKGAQRDPGRDGGATLVIQTGGKKGWFWYIPLHNDITSVGIVRAFDELFEGNRDHETIYQEELENCPAVKERVSMGTRCDRFYATKDYSYKATQCAGDGWVLVGDAHGFLDPLYSSGVLLALKSGQMAADAIGEGLTQGDLSATQLGKWGPEFNEGMDRMRRLVCEYYDGFSFGAFVRKHPHFKGHLTDLLIGNLFNDQVGEVFGPMDEMRAEMARADA